MFQQSILSSEESRRPWTFSVSLLAQALFIAVAVMIPLLARPALPVLNAAVFGLEPPPMPRPQAPPPAQQVAAPSLQRFSAVLVQPTHVPDHALPLVDMPPNDIQVGGPSTPWPVGETGFISDVVTPVKPPTPQPPAEPEAPAAPIRVSIEVQAARIVRRVMPVYPPLARTAGVSGKVRLQAIIAIDGSIAELNVISGHPLLVKAATDAVQQWLYRPTVLNGRLVPVDTQIEVNFTLGR